MTGTNAITGLQGNLQNVQSLKSNIRLGRARNQQLYLPVPCKCLLNTTYYLSDLVNSLNRKDEFKITISRLIILAKIIYKKINKVSEDVWYLKATQEDFFRKWNVALNKYIPDSLRGEQWAHIDLTQVFLALVDFIRDLTKNLNAQQHEQLYNEINRELQLNQFLLQKNSMISDLNSNLNTVDGIIKNILEKSLIPQDILSKFTSNLSIRRQGGGTRKKRTKRNKKISKRKTFKKTR